MLTWGAFNIVGGTHTSREQLRRDQQSLLEKVKADIDRMSVETDGCGWRAKVFLYCVEARCPQTGWMLPLLPTLAVSKGFKVIVELVPDPVNKRYNIIIHKNVDEKNFREAKKGLCALMAGARTHIWFTLWTAPSTGPRSPHCVETIVRMTAATATGYDLG